MRGQERGTISRYPYYREMAQSRPKYNVPINITESETAYTVEVFATGFTKEDITVSVVDDVLYIIGSKKDVAKKAFSRQEFPIKNFERTLNLNGQIATELVSAKSENGILVIALPKSPEAQKSAQEIKIE
jgi:HSP20 family protein